MDLSEALLNQCIFTEISCHCSVRESAASIPPHGDLAGPVSAFVTSWDFHWLHYAIYLSGDSFPVVFVFLSGSYAAFVCVIIENKSFPFQH